MSGGFGITNLNRIDLALVAGSNRKCIAVLPRQTGKAKKQKVVAGDTEGYLRWFTLGKTGDMEACYRVQTPNKIPFNAISIDEREEGNKKIFAAAGDTIWGYKEPKTKDTSRIDKPFFTLQTNISEPIRCMSVKAPFIWLAGEYIIASFDNGSESAYLPGSDSVNDLILAHVTQQKTYEAVVASQDRTIKVINGKEVATNVSCEGAVSSVAHVMWSHQPQQAQTLRSAKKSKKVDHDASKEEVSEIIYGTANGFLGSYKVTPHGLSKLWATGGSADARGGIAALLANDSLSVGMPQIVVGRDDGNLEVHGYDLGNDQPVPSFKSAGNESIQGVASGCIMNMDREDVVVATYTGKIVGYINDAQEAPLWSNTGAAAMPEDRAKQISVANAEKKKKLAGLNEEVEKLRARLVQKKDEYSKVSTAMVPVTAHHHVKDKFVLEPAACWSLGIEIDGPIDTVAIQSDVDLELIDTDANACIISTTVPEAGGSTKLLACYRCTETTSRIQMKVRTIEGQHGLLRAFVIPFLTPKTCQQVSYSIKPLSLHQRLSEKPANLSSCMVLLRMEGAFSTDEMNSWVHDCLPEVPRKQQKDAVVYYFVSTLLGTQLRVQFKQGEAVFASNNVSTLIVLSEFIGKAATQSKTQLSVTSDTAHLTECCVHVLQLLSPKLEYQLSLSDKVAVMESLKEIEMQEQDTAFLSQEYQQVLQNTAAIEKEHALQPRKLDFLYGLVRRLYLDRHALKGTNAANKIPALMQLLQHRRYSLDELIEFFKSG
eukprot:TRINITY_DN13524_c0_g2_i1.p1 TRINITY_DN13524_c0_g2~~TRINITY_DN13524_c0_g2_i1.p1  ORF type:complete len:769 (+),score=341.13 TRINITY_DN13524_c0_g2_i1:81-2387(+)